MKYTIFNGPRKEFDKRVPLDGVMTLTDMVRFIDPGGNDSVEPMYPDILVIHSDEYSGVADFFIEGFLFYSSSFAKRFGYGEVLLHNPPLKIKQQLQNSHADYIEVEEENHQYTNLNLEHLKAIKNNFEKTIHGQKEVKNQILTSLYSLTNSGKHKPTVVMLYGPTSVGKTETAKLVNIIINPEYKLFRKQLSMFHNESFMNYIFGDKSTSFAKDLLDRETNIILLDEFDKAHSMFYSAFYQLFDEGVYVDKFYEVNLENTIIFCTSNYQSKQEIEKNLGAPIFSRFDHFIEFEKLDNEAKMNIIEEVYNEEILKFSQIDQQEIQNQNVKERLKSKVSSLKHAREIRKLTIQLMARLLINKI
ncbi:AAA family ATPase [Marinococcus sp. PL1-022]|uniref:AAA family ATPase n=1 Tax=Marinococcus sp. PL1-022 TaxID=3095363 RepID=UPI0029C24159|nr:AAA family ATPase [Marinococcus sp. PL1-022]MDX6154486.1 AAA family ATPase [Marinococcus sp. PL1-022]